MKKAFSKILVMLLTVCMLVSVLSVGISAATVYHPHPHDNYYVSLSLSQQYSYDYYYYSNVVSGYISGDRDDYYRNGVWDWYTSSSSVSISNHGSYATLTTTSFAPVSVTVYAVVRPTADGYSDIYESISITVYPDSYMYPGYYYTEYPYWWYGYDWSDIPYWWAYDWYGTYPYASNVIYVNGTAYPWCGYESSSSCSSSWCIHNLIKYSTSYITRDTKYCSSSCNHCGNPFNHHSINWFVNGGKDTSSSFTSTTVTPKEGVKTISAVERLAEFRKNQGKTEEKETTEKKKTTSKWINIYKDVDVKSWYYDYIKFVSENDYIKGKDTFEFGVNSTISRAEFAEAFGKFAGIEKDTASDYIKWAVSKGFLAESSEKGITKEEAVNAVYKYVLSLDKKISDGSSKTDYIDSDKVNEDYKDAVNWAVSNGLIGISANKISPTDSLVKTRLAQFLYNLDTYLGR